MAIDDWCASDDDWELPLTPNLQNLVDEAPGGYPHIDEYFEVHVERCWKDSAAKYYAIAVYYATSCEVSLRDTPCEVVQDAGFFAAEMRVKRERVLRT